MEFYNFLKENNITSFEVLKNIVEKEPYFLKVKEDNMVSELALIHNTNEININLNIVRVCNGLVIEKNSLKIVCYTFDKCKEENIVSDEVNYHESYIEDAIEGTLLRLYFYNNTWILSTKKCIRASSSKWISTKNFQELFMESTNAGLLDNLDKNNCYSFILAHPENNIIYKPIKPILYHISTRDMTTLNEIEVDINVKKMNRVQFGQCISHVNITEIYDQYVKHEGINSEGYVFIDLNYRRHKIIKNNIKDIKQLWGNNNNRFFRYLELRKDKDLLKRYIDIFSNDKTTFIEFEKEIYNLSNKILQVYLNKFVEKTNLTIPFYFKRTIFKLHGDFLKSREQTNKIKIMNYLLEIDPKEICFMLNNIKKEDENLMVV